MGYHPVVSNLVVGQEHSTTLQDCLLLMAAIGAQPMINSQSWQQVLALQYCAMHIALQTKQDSSVSVITASLQQQQARSNALKFSLLQ